MNTATRCEVCRGEIVDKPPVNLPVGVNPDDPEARVSHIDGEPLCTLVEAARGQR